MNITFTIPDDKKDTLLGAFCWQFGYDENKLVDETKLQFSKRMWTEKAKTIYKNYQEYLRTIGPLDTIDIT